jgi:hypothetical protein
MSEAYFGDYDMSSFDFIGFHETRHRDIQILGGMIDLPLSGNLHVNRTQVGNQRRIEIKNDLATMRRLNALLSNDIKFYEKQRERFGGHKF